MHDCTLPYHDRMTAMAAGIVTLTWVGHGIAQKRVDRTQTHMGCFLTNF